jgi:hypothetical protein
MKKKLVTILMLFTASVIIHSCCEDKKYKSTLSKLEYSGIEFNTENNDTVYVSMSTRLVIRFHLFNDFKEISLGSFIPRCEADGGFCTDQTTWEKYEDPIEKISIVCDKDLVRATANQELTSLTQGYYWSPDPEYSVAWGVLKEYVNNNPYHYESGMRIWLEVSSSDLLETGNHKFTMRLETLSGKVVQATSDNIYWVK